MVTTQRARAPVARRPESSSTVVQMVDVLQEQNRALRGRISELLIETERLRRACRELPAELTRE